MRRIRRHRVRARRGVALVAALGLLVLAAALLAGSAIASVGLRRATRGLTAAARAEWEGQRALGEVMTRWDGVADSLPIGAWLERPLPAHGLAGPPLTVRAGLQRLTPSVYSASAWVWVGDSASAQAFRRVRLLLERRPSGDSALAVETPTPIARWSVIDRR